MSRSKSTTTMTPTPDALDLSEEDAYAHLVTVANDNATDNDKKKLVKAGLLPDLSKTSDASSIDDNQTQTPVAKSPETPPAVPQSSRVRTSAIRFIIARANGVSFKAALKQAGAEWFDLQRFRWTNPQFAVVQDFVEREKVNIIAAKASDALESLIDGDASAETRNAKAVMFALERLKRDQFSDPKKSDSGQATGKGGGIVYNITFQGGPQPNLCGVCVGNPLQSPVIDIKGE